MRDIQKELMGNLKINYWSLFFQFQCTYSNHSRFLLIAIHDIRHLNSKYLLLPQGDPLEPYLFNLNFIYFLSLQDLTDCYNQY